MCKMILASIILVRHIEDQRWKRLSTFKKVILFEELRFSWISWLELWGMGRLGIMRKPWFWKGSLECVCICLSLNHMASTLLDIEERNAGSAFHFIFYFLILSSSEQREFLMIPLCHLFAPAIPAYSLSNGVEANLSSFVRKP